MSAVMDTAGFGRIQRPAPLTTVPDDVLLMLSASLFDPLRPEQHAPLYASCKSVRHALAGAVDVLRAQCGALRATLAKTGYSARDIAGASDLCWYGKSLDDADCRQVAWLIRSGALSHLETLRLSINQISDQGVQEIASALSSRQLPNLSRLWLSNNKIGDAGMASLSRACAALPRLRALYLHNNAVSAAGMRAFAAAVSGGGGGGLLVFSQLETLWLDTAEAKAEAEAEGGMGSTDDSPAAALARGALPSLRWLFVSSGADKQLEATCAERGIALL